MGQCGVNRIVKSKIAYQSKWIKVYEDQVKDKDGNKNIFNRISVCDGVEIVPFLDDGSVIMVNHYRYGAGKYVLELPAGRIERGEPLVSSAKRELVEETGYSCRQMKKIGWYYYLPSRSKQKTHVFVAKGLHFNSKQKLDDLEHIKLVQLSRNQVIQKMRTGQIKNAGTVTSLLLAGL